MRMALNESGSFGFSKKLKMSFTLPPNFFGALEARNRFTDPPAPVRSGSGRRGGWLGTSTSGLGTRLHPLVTVAAATEVPAERTLALGRSALQQLHVQGQRLELLEQHVEG